jgi:hypothetical protein
LVPLEIVALPVPGSTVIAAIAGVAVAIAAKSAVAVIVLRSI